MPEYGEIVNMRGLHSVQDKPEYALKIINMREYA